MTTILPLPPRPAPSAPDGAAPAGSAPDSGFSELVAASMVTYTAPTERAPDQPADHSPEQPASAPANTPANTPASGPARPDQPSPPAQPAGEAAKEGTKARSEPLGQPARTGTTVAPESEVAPIGMSGQGAPLLAVGAPGRSAGDGAAREPGAAVGQLAHATGARHTGADAQGGTATGGRPSSAPGTAAAATRVETTGVEPTRAGTTGVGTTGPAAEGGPAAEPALGPAAGPANGPGPGPVVGLGPVVGPVVPATTGTAQPTVTGSRTHVRPNATASVRIADDVGPQELGHLESRVLSGAAPPIGPPTGLSATLISPQPPGTHAPTGSSVAPQIMGEITAMMARADGTQRIRLRLSPESLGDVSVILTVRGGAVEVTLGASGAGRAALEQSTTELHRLLELAGARSTAVLVKELSLPGAASFAPSVPVGQEPGQWSQGQSGLGQWGQGHSQQAGRNGDLASSARRPAPDDHRGMQSATTPPRTDNHRTSLDVSI